MLWLGTYTRIYEEKENLPPGGNLLKKYKIIQEFVKTKSVDNNFVSILLCWLFWTLKGWISKKSININLYLFSYAYDFEHFRGGS